MKQSSKILFVSTNGQYGGSEVLWVQVMNRLQGSDLNAACLIPNWDKVPVQLSTIESENPFIFKYGNPSKNDLFHRVLKKLKLTPEKDLRFYVRHTLATSQPDIVVISIGDHSNYEFTVVCEELIRLNTPYLVLVQLATEFRDITDNLSEKLKSSYTHAKRCFFLCEKNQRIVENHIGVKLSNAEKFQSPFQMERLDLPALDYSVNSDGCYGIGMVTNLNIFHKGHDLVFEALAGNEWKDRNFELNIFGHGSNQRLVERLIIRYGLEKKVKLKGYVQSAEEIWQNNHVCLFVSRMEGQSLAMLDAISLGRMVIATDVGDSTNLIEDQHTGYIIPSLTAKSVSTVFDSAWARRNDWQQMGEKGKLKLKEIFKKDPVNNMIEKIRMEIS